MSDFKNYLSNKKKIQQQQESKPQLNQSIASQLKESNWSQSPKKKADMKEKCYEEELSKKIFRDLTGKAEKNTLVEKITFIEYNI